MEADRVFLAILALLVEVTEMLRSLLFAFVGVGVQLSAGSHLDVEQLAVIRSVVQTAIPANGAVLVRTETSTPTALLSHFENRRGGLTLDARVEGEPDIVVTREIWRAFGNANSDSSDLPVLPAMSGVLIASTDRLRLLIPDATSESWDRFRAEWPHVTGVVTLTRPAISSNGNAALMYMSVTRGPLDAEGSLYLLERKGDLWVIKARYVVIAS
jgi:hypothetical protein